jgi:ferredoxin
MTYVVTDLCSGCRYTECVSVCPVECFHFDATMVYIDPDTCIDCGGCVPVCPVGAIQAGHRLPQDKQAWTEINRIRAGELPVLIGRMTPLPGADERKQRLGL